GANWPPDFYADFTSWIRLTYRLHFPPIRDSNLQELTPPAWTVDKWNWTVGGLGGEKGWMSNSGWGCMLRTGQSLLANSLLFMHLGRDWRVSLSPEMTREYAIYVQIVTWFLDTPSELAPFSVHRMALAGKDLGKDVRMWFGPSTAAGAIR
ncbi:hypothetical protein F5876DRAFT_53937, partial [Lentinula aff. lateritia]